MGKITLLSWQVETRFLIRYGDVKERGQAVDPPGGRGRARSYWLGIQNAGQRVARRGYMATCHPLAADGVGTGNGVEIPKVRAKTGEPVTFRSALVPPYVRKISTLEAALYI